MRNHSPSLPNHMFNLFKRRQKRMTMATLAGPRTVRRMRNWENISDDDRKNRPFVTLERDDECLVTTTLHWFFVTQFSHAVGEWRPSGTDAEKSSLATSGPQAATLLKGSYFPLGQTVSESDARRLAEGIERGLQNLPALIGDGTKPQAWAVDDRRLWPSYETPDSVQLADLYALDVDKNIDTFVEFFSRGSFRITLGLPVELAPETPRQKEAREKRQQLERERDNLLDLLQRGNVSAAVVGGRLQALTTQLETLSTTSN